MPLAEPTSKPSTCRGWRALTGTPAQIAAAEPIRERLLLAMGRAVRTASHINAVANLNDTRSWLLTQTDAAFWLQHARWKPSMFIRLRYAAASEGYRALFAGLRAARAQNRGTL